MTDSTNDLDQAERIRRLQARRGATQSTPGAATQRPKRGHPAAATRWMLAGLSVASFFTVAGTVAVAGQSSVSSPATVTTPAPAVATVATPAATPAAAPAAATPAPAASTRAAAPVAHTVTRGS